MDVEAAGEDLQVVEQSERVHPLRTGVQHLAHLESHIGYNESVIQVILLLCSSESVNSGDPICTGCQIWSVKTSRAWDDLPILPGQQVQTVVANQLPYLTVGTKSSRGLTDQMSHPVRTSILASPKLAAMTGLSCCEDKWFTGDAAAAEADDGNRGFLECTVGLSQS